MCSSLEFISRDVTSMNTENLRVKESLPLFLKYFFGFEKFHYERIEFPINYSFVENSLISITGKRNSQKWDFGKYSRFYREAEENNMVAIKEQGSIARVSLLMTDHWHHEYIFEMKNNRWYLIELKAFLHSKLPINL